MEKHYISTTKTGRYFTLGKLSAKTKHVLFVFHGYAQNADDFIQEFKDFEREDTFVIAPEGLAHFYWKDLFSNPVTSWMTSLEREKEIEDNNNYLQNIFNQLFEGVDISTLDFHFLAFSQSGPIMSRWLDKTNIQPKNLFFYASEIAKETYENKINYFFQDAQLFFIYGNEDRLVRKELLNALKIKFSEKNIIFDIYVFKGKHRIEKEALQYIASKIYNNE